jgi:pyruvate kinase
MVARGDLGLEVPIEELAYWQKLIVQSCRQAHKPVIVATQMLESMVNNDMPTRAEATDVANAVYDGTDAVMLSEESSMGKYPVKAVDEMVKILAFSENHKMFDSAKLKNEVNLTEILIQAVAVMVKNSKELPISNVVVFTQSGETARILSSYRLGIPIVAVSDKPETLDFLNLSFGIRPYLRKFTDDQFRITDPVFDEMIAADLLHRDETILVIHGNNWMSQGSSQNISLKKL